MDRQKKTAKIPKFVKEANLSNSTDSDSVQPDSPQKKFSGVQWAALLLILIVSISVAALLLAGRSNQTGNARNPTSQSTGVQFLFRSGHSLQKLCRSQGAFNAPGIEHFNISASIQTGY